MISENPFSYHYGTLINGVLEDDGIEYIYSFSDSSPSSSDNNTVSSSSNSPVYEELSPMDATSIIGNFKEPYLTVSFGEDFKNTTRFRYASEKGQHGGPKPVVELHNCEFDFSEIFIKATVYTADEKQPHVLELRGKQCINGVCWQKLSSDYTAKFPALSIYTKKKDEIAAILEERKRAELKQPRKKLDESEIQSQIKEEKKSLNLSCVKLCFEALHHKKDPIGGKVFSETIFNQKNIVSGELNITRLSSYSGKCSGGDEVILLCNKIRKDDIEIHVEEELPDGTIEFVGKGKFNPADVHHQVAIPFKMPPYKNNDGAIVLIKLYRKSDAKYGEGRQFRYIPDDNSDDAPSSKRKRGYTVEDMLITSSTNEMFNINLDETSDASEPTPGTSQDLYTVNIHDPMSPFNANAPFEVLGINLSSLLGCGPMDNSDKNIGFNIDAAISDLISLNLSKENEDKKTELKKSNLNSSIEEELNKLKECFIHFIRSRTKSSFMEFLPALVTIKDENHNNLLHLMINEKSGDLVTLIKLLQVTPNDLKNAKNRFHQTPLHLAISRKLWKIVRVLLLFGADPNITDKNGNNCVHLAAKHNLAQCLKEILSPSPNKDFKKCVPSINVLNYEGLAPLHLSVMNESKACTELLIEAKANINIADGKSGKTPLHFAFEQGSKLVDYLLAQPGIDITVVDFNGNIPIAKGVVSHEGNMSTVLAGCIKSENIENNDDADVKKNNLCEQNGQVLFKTTKSTECCIEISSENNSDEDNSTIVSETNEVKSEIIIDSSIEKKLCEILDHNGQWRKLGDYILKKQELDDIAEIDKTPTITILNLLRDRHGKKYSSELMYILEGDEFKEVREVLKL